MLDADTCYRALCARDPRFDGLFFVGVTTTGVYCRPVCHARTPRRQSCVFFPSAAHADREGFRACLLCRPELAPGSDGVPVDAVHRLADRAAARIAAGALNGGSLEALAAGLGVSSRHLRRALVACLGLSPVELAQSHRLAFAKRLLQDSRMPLAELALASGFGSVRRFNALFRARFGRPPGSVRRQAPLPAGEAAGADRAGRTALRLDYRPPLALRPLLEFLAPRAIPGVEEVLVDAGEYRRTVALGDAVGWVRVRAHHARPALVAEVSCSLAPALMPLVPRLRRLFDLDAHPAEIDGALGAHPRLRRLVSGTPGLRVPGAFDGFEASVRAVLGQQVTVKGATTLAGRLVECFGAPVATPFPALTRLFPGPGQLVRSAAAIAGLGMPLSRARTVEGLARASQQGLALEPGGDRDATLASLAAVPGIGGWTAQIIAMRALGWPDAFPGSDLVLRRALGVHREREAERLAEPFRPFRAYATLHLWRTA